MGLPRFIAEALATKLATDIPSFVNVYPDWPEQNQQLVYPCASIFTGEPQYARCPPYLKTQGTTNVMTNTASNIYVVGQFDFNLQLDIWARYKVERDSLYQLVFNVIEPVTPRGFNLQLSSYYNEWVTFTQTSFKFLDDPDSVALKQWRVLVNLKATCRAINTTTDYIITQDPVLILETPDSIPA